MSSAIKPERAECRTHELSNIIERAVIFTRGKTPEFDLPTSQNQPHIQAISTEFHTQSSPDAGFFTEAEMSQKNRHNLGRVLEKANWKIKGTNGTAELLGIKPNTLLARIKRPGFRRENDPGAKSSSP